MKAEHILIGSPDELMWFDKHAQMTDSAVLTADITINEDVNAEATGLYKWTPIGCIKITVHLLNIRVHLTVMDIPFRSLCFYDRSGYTSNYVGLFGYAGNGQ